MLTQELDYDLPPDRIATQPSEPRDAARLMVIERGSGRTEHRQVRDLGTVPGPLRSGDLLVFNKTRVLPAHFGARRRATGGSVSGLYLESVGQNGWIVMLESRGKLRVGESVDFVPAAESYLELVQRLGSGQWRAWLHSPWNTLELLNRIGSAPLPPYIRKARRTRRQIEVAPGDAERYNTVFAKDAGSVAAPTAALHFTDQLLADISALGVRRAELTLHVGLGTFAPIRTARVEHHVMHREWLSIPRQTVAALSETREAGGRIIPVGTTCVRALESLPPTVPTEGFCGHTDLYITGGQGADGASSPPFPFRFADALMTNFHLPRSTLLVLVAALPGVGLERLKRWYQYAIEQHYRFYSYGDAMLLV